MFALREKTSVMRGIATMARVVVAIALFILGMYCTCIYI